MIVPKCEPFPPTTLISTVRQGTPGVAALGEGVQVLQNAETVGVGGTSTSASTFAAIVDVLSENQLLNNKKSFGFFNSWMYANPRMFTHAGGQAMTPEYV